MVESAEAWGYSLGDAMRRCVGEERALEASDVQLAGPWSLFHAHFDGRTLADRFAEAVTPRPAVARWLEAEQGCWLSAWQVRRVDPGLGMDLEDVLTGAERFVFEKAATRLLEPGVLILARVADLDDLSVLAGLHPQALAPLAAEAALQAFMGPLFPGRTGLEPEELRSEATTLALVEAWRESARQKPPGAGR